MYELQRGGVQIQTVRRLAVEVVAYHRMVQSLRMGGMYTELMGTSRMRIECNSCSSVFAFQYPIGSDRQFTIFPAYHLARTIHRVRTDGQVDDALVSFQFSFQQGCVTLLDKTRFEKCLKFLVHFLRFGRKPCPSGAR